jgi:uncharacterized protein (TIGR02246 family)
VEDIMFATDSARAPGIADGTRTGKALLRVFGALATVYGAAHATTWTFGMVRRWLVAIAVATLSSPWLQAQAPPVDTAAGPRLNGEIVNVVELYRRAALGGDAHAVAALYTEDAVELPACEPLVRGRAAIEQRYQKFFKGPVKRTTFTFSHLEAASEGDMGHAVGTYDQRLVLPSGQTVTDTGKYVVILRRTQGEWRAAYAIYNSDTPQLPSPAAGSEIPPKR